jgi:hypothetical protein
MQDRKETLRIVRLPGETSTLSRVLPSAPVLANWLTFADATSNDGED